MSATGISEAERPAGMLGVLELGTNSLKLHLCGQDRILPEPLRIEWEMGFEVYAMRCLSDASIQSATEQVRRLLDRCPTGGLEGVFGVATGVFEEAENTAELLDRLDREFDIPVRVLAGPELSRLLALGFQDRVLDRPAMVFDLGCGRLERVFLGAGDGKFLHDSLPLGVLRVFHLASFDSGEWNEEAATRFIRENLRGAKSLALSRIHGTGGALRTVAQVAGTHELTREVLARVESETREHGPPRFLSPRRQAIFLPGVVILKHLLEHAGAERVTQHPVDLGTVLMDRLRPHYRALGSRLRDVFIQRQIDILS
jgi:exopolyphosphatase/pppGpp-phosphohydrolase